MDRYTSILAVVSNKATGAAPVAAALKLAADGPGYVEGLHVRIDPAHAIPFVGEGISGSMVDDMIQLADQEAKERASAAKTMFLDHCKEAGVHVVGTDEIVDRPIDAVTAKWREEMGDEDTVAGLAARACDLVVAARPMPDKEVPSLSTLNAILLEASAPVVVTPPPDGAHEKSLDLAHMGKVAIAWNGSDEAARAVTGGMPFLRAAKEVRAFVTETATEGPNGHAALRAWLGRRGVEVETEVFSAGMSRVGEQLIDAIGKWDADLLVMGAYTHSRMRQLILGGVTRYVIYNAKLPVLMSH